MTLVIMSNQELDRFSIIKDLIARRLKPRAAADLLGVSRHQVFRLRQQHLTQGAQGLVSRLQGKSSSRKLPEAVKLQVIQIVKDRYSDFGPTLAREKASAAAWDHDRHRDHAAMDEG